MYVKLKDNIINLDVIKSIDKLDGYYHYKDDVDCHYLINDTYNTKSDLDVQRVISDLYQMGEDINTSGYYGFYINYLSGYSIFVKLSHDLEDSTRLYNEFLKYISSNQASIPEIK